MATVEAEATRRSAMWAELLNQGGPNGVQAAVLRNLGIYGGAQGIWVNKEVTAGLTPDGFGVAVSVLHTGTSYADDLTEDGLIYHYPDTGRLGGRDAAEAAALRNAHLLRFPVYVITHAESNQTRRDVRQGWVVDFDDESCLILFGSAAPALIDVGTPFRHEANRSEITRMARRLRRDPAFAFGVGKRVGWKCAVCSIAIRLLLDAAHVRGVAEKGSDDPRNGLVLCKNHHAAFDGGLFNIEPESGVVVVAPELTIAELSISVDHLPDERRPHIDALRWRWQRAYQKTFNLEAHSTLAVAQVPMPADALLGDA